MNSHEIKYQNYILVSCIFMFSGMMAAINQFKIPTIMTDVAGIFNMSIEQAAWMMSIFMFVGIFLALPTGSFGQKWGPKNMMMVAAIFVAGGSLLGSMASSGAMMIFSRGLEGVGFIFVTVCGPMAISKYVHPSKIGSAMGIWAVWVCIGQVIANNLTPPLYTSVGLSGVWLVYSMFTLLMAVVVMFVIKTPDQLKHYHNAQNSVKIYEAFKNRDLWYLCLSFLLFNIVLMTVLAFAPTYLTSNGVNLSTAAFATSIPMLLALISSPTFGKISDKIGSRKKLYLLALLAMGPGAVMMFNSTGALMYGGAILLGMVGLGAPPMALSAMGEIVKNSELMGPSMGLIMTCQNIGMFLGSMLMPYFLQVSSGSWEAAAWISLPIAFVSVIIAAIAKFK